MRTSYSLDFLQDDWEGAGFDLELACVFDHENIHNESMSSFIYRVIHSLKEISIKYFFPSKSLSEWQFIDINEADSFLNNELDVENTEWFFLEFTSTNGFSGYISLAPFHHVEIGGPSENYYTGNNERDIAIAQDIVSIAVLAANAFGDGYCSFGGGTTSIQQAIKLQKGTQLPNLTSSTDTNALAEMIVETCTELRTL